MRDIAQFFQQESLVDIFTKIALIHYQFEILRPFPSLNGVIGRMGISMLLFEAGFRAAPFLCISDFLLQNTEAYFSQLSSTQRNGDYLSWVKFMLGGFTSAAKKRIALIKQYEALIVKDRGKVKKFAFSENTLLVYDYYKANLAAEIPEAAKNLNLSFNTVSKAVELLQKKKILELVNKQSDIENLFTARRQICLFKITDTQDILTNILYNNQKGTRRTVMSSEKQMKAQISAKGMQITVVSDGSSDDYISLTDIARYKSEDPSATIQNWMRNRDVIEFLGLWETIHNADFKPLEFEGFRQKSGYNAFTLSPKRWADATSAIGIYSKAGRYGGTYAHRDIAFEFAS